MSTEIQPNIRKAVVEDSHNLASLASKAFLGYPFEYVFTSEGVSNAISNGEKRYVMRDQIGQIVGSAVLGDSDSKMSEIMRVMIEPSLRKNGAATYLTRHLALEAIQEGKYSWADVRGDQIGMQRAALGSGMKAISLEQGKHAVYNHQDQNGNEIGPARESMVHMTTLPVDELSLKKEIIKLPNSIREELAKNLKNSLSPDSKEKSLSELLLPSANRTKDRILNNLNLNSQIIDTCTNLNSDILKITINGVDTIVVLPDASAFILNRGDLTKTIDLITKSGIQVATFYCNLNDETMQNKLIALGLEAVSIRPWIIGQSKDVVWQIAWRKTANDYKYCLHSISLDPIVERQLRKIINIIEN